jgi:hypothetical protein
MVKCRLFFVKTRRRGTAARVSGLSLNSKSVSYLRVSTNRQGKSRLGQEAQRAAVVNLVASLNGQAEIVKDFVEVESGKKAARNRGVKIIGRIDGDWLHDGTGKLVARYDEWDNRTRDRDGKIVGSGNQRLRKLADR